MSDESTPKLIGRYLVERIIGRGAMGIVYKAHDPDIDRPVAIKLIRADLLDGDDRTDFLARFRREARTAGRCVHPNIVSIFDFAMHEGNPFIAMEFVDGSSLADVTGKRIAPAEAIYITAQMLDALACAHDLGIIHRDIKPANILQQADGQVKVTDFGISRAAAGASDLTQSGAMIGTPSYMSPEQCRGDDIDTRSDLFSAGAILYELLSGEKPFPGRTVTHVMAKLLGEEPPDLAAKVPALAPALAAAVHRALAKQPDQRFPSARAMAAALAAALHGEAPVQPDDATIIAGSPQSVRAPVSVSTARSSRTTALSAAAAAPRNANGLPHPTLSVAGASGSGQTGIGSSAVNAPNVAATDIEHLTSELAFFLGPIAKVLIRRIAPAAASVQDLRQQLAAHIESESDRAAFLKKG